MCIRDIFKTSDKLIGIPFAVNIQGFKSTLGFKLYRMSFIQGRITVLHNTFSLGTVKVLLSLRP